MATGNKKGLIIISKEKSIKVNIYSGSVLESSSNSWWIVNGLWLSPWDETKPQITNKVIMNEIRLHLISSKESLFSGGTFLRFDGVMTQS